MNNRVRYLRYFASFLTLFALSQLYLSASSSAEVFNPPSIYFNGEASTYIKVPHKSSFDIGNGEFTFAWWQKSGIQSTENWPRIFQFGVGAAGSDGFGISQESGSIYFWLDNRIHGQPCPSEDNLFSGLGRCGNRINAIVPIDNDLIWHHFSIVRKKQRGNAKYFRSKSSNKLHT